MISLYMGSPELDWLSLVVVVSDGLIGASMFRICVLEFMKATMSLINSFIRRLPGVGDSLNLK